jgi:hypothetical protein
MIIPFPYISDFNVNAMFSSPSIKHPYDHVRVVELKEREGTPVFDCWATTNFTIGNEFAFTPFVNTFPPTSERPFSDNQPVLLSYANQIFEGSRPLSEFEQKVLARTIRRLAKREPTKSHRR